MKEKRGKIAEAFIRQEYDFGDRIEYDFGEVKLVIDGVCGKYYLAVFGSPKGKFRWAYLYNNQKKEVFLDSHVRFFEMVGGAYREAVYDNMKNVVTRFIGRNEKELNPDLIAMSTYYGAFSRPKYTKSLTIEGILCYIPSLTDKKIFTWLCYFAAHSVSDACLIYFPMP